MWAQPPRATRNGIGQGGVFRRLPGGCIVLLTLIMTSGTAWACETPVYRYAMYRWQPTPYEVYSFHDASNADAHAAVEKAIADVSEGTDNRANVVFIPVNLATDPELNGVTPDIKAAWQSQPDRTLPTYLISTPYGVQIYSGKLSADEITALVESPARKQMAQQLEAGKIGVLLFLGGRDQTQNDQTRQILQGLVKEVGEGKIPLYTAPAAGGAPEPEPASAVAENAAAENAAAKNAAAQAASPGLELGLIEINRDDKNEAWLVRSLLAMESDLPEESRPMVFLAYGRGRALLPYIGAGITRENLIHEVEFISGACSCTVKEQNPGVDLLVRYDWDAASAALADRFGTEEGNESQFGPSDFLPQLIIPSSTAPPVTDAAATRENTGVSDRTASGSETEIAIAATDDVPLADPVAEPDVPAGGGGLDDAPDGGDTDVAARQTPAPGDEGSAAVADVATAKDAGTTGELASLPATSPTATVSKETFRTDISMLVVGGGLALGLVILFGLTLFVMRPH